MVILLISYCGYIKSVFKDNKSLWSHKTVENIVYLNFLLVDGRIRILEAQKHTDPELLVQDRVLYNNEWI